MNLKTSGTIGNPMVSAAVQAARLQGLKAARISLIKYTTAGSYAGIVKTWMFEDMQDVDDLLDIQASMFVIDENVTIDLNYKYGLSIGYSYDTTDDSYKTSTYITAKVYDIIGQYTSSTSKGGGLRVESIVTKDHDNTILLKKEYDYAGGILHQPPSFYSNVVRRSLCFTQQNTGGGGFCNVCQTPTAPSWNLHTLSSQSNLNQLNNNVLVGYRTVTERQMDGMDPLGRTTYDFKNTEDYHTSRSFPTSMRMDNGLLEYLRIYDDLGVKKYEKYNNWSSVTDQTLAQKYFGSIAVDHYVGPENAVCKEYSSGQCSPISWEANDLFANRYTLWVFNIRSEQWRLGYVTEQQIEDGTSFATKTVYAYNTIGQMTKETVYSLDDAAANPVLEYDLTNSYVFENKSTVPYNNMYSANYLNFLVSTSKTRNSKTIHSGSLSYASSTFSALGQNYTGYYPISTTQSKDGSGTLLTTSNYAYINGKIVEQATNGNSKGYVWNGNELMAVADNSLSEQIAFTGFEHGNSDGNWNFTGGTTTTDSHLGSSSHNSNSSGSISKTGLPSGDYIVSFWAKKRTSTSPKLTINGIVTSITNSGWKYFEVKISGTSASLTANNIYLDDLRLYPSDATMTSFQYDYPDGLSSRLDVNGFPTYYFYDTSGRLHLIKDHDGNLLKQYEYNYKD